MKTFQWLAISSLAIGLMALSGCVVERDHDRGEYRYEHGDRIDSYGHREAHWCDNHRDDEHCRP